MLVVNVRKCLGCKSCEVACAVEHSESRDLFTAIQEKPAPRTRVRVGQGEGFAVPLQCRHCEDAPCIKICPTAALYRADADSPVVLNQDQCIGCNWCVLACPFGVISFDAQGRTLLKCDQCFERVERGERPACVEGCPSGALAFKTADEVVAGKQAASLVQIEAGLGGEDA
ncbi:MAG: 4Fe-4S dicluster domain-containing protein [Nitrospiraceae bacterium]|nr:4Fe-4S dicluster domain-containing protein [Nitrospiraceae bacterium]